jgi:hypothetical protein
MTSNLSSLQDLKPSFKNNPTPNNPWNKNSSLFIMMKLSP